MALTPNERKGKLVAAGTSIRAVARDLGYRTHCVVRLVVSGKMRSARVEQHIADVIGMAPEDVFGPWPAPAEEPAVAAVT